MVRILAILAFATLPIAMGQALVEHAVAAAGGSIGGVMGKQVSDQIDKSLSQTAIAIGKAAETKSAVRVPVPASRASIVRMEAATPLPRVKLPPPQRLAVVRPARAAQPQRVIAAKATKNAKSLIQTVVDPDPTPTILVGGRRPPETVIALLGHLGQGMSKSDVVKHLGEPTFKITIADGSRVVEILNYRHGHKEL